MPLAVNEDVLVGIARTSYSPRPTVDLDQGLQFYSRRMEDQNSITVPNQFHISEARTGDPDLPILARSV